MKNQTIDKNSREYLERQRANGRNNLLLVVIFTVINLVLLLTDSGTYFLFSASVPYYFTALGMGMDLGAGIEGIGVFTGTALVISALILIAYLLCWIFSKKRIGWIIAALVLFIVDSVLLIVMGLAMDLLTDSIMDLVFHAWVVVSLCQVLSADKKLKALPPEEIAEEAPAAPVAAPVTEEPWNQPDKE